MSRAISDALMICFRVDICTLRHTGDDFAENKTCPAVVTAVFKRPMLLRDCFRFA